GRRLLSPLLDERLDVLAPDPAAAAAALDLAEVDAVLAGQPADQGRHPGRGLAVPLAVPLAVALAVAGPGGRLVLPGPLLGGRPGLGLLALVLVGFAGLLGLGARALLGRLLLG